MGEWEDSFLEKVGVMMFQNIAEFRNIVFTRRNVGKVTCEIGSFEELKFTEDIDSFVIELGFSGLGNEWRIVDESRAREILHYVLSLDLAYDQELESSSLAEELTQYFIMQFSGTTTYYTNADFDYDRGFGKGLFGLRSWSPLSKAIFDTGVIAINEEKVGILWVEDND